MSSTIPATNPPTRKASTTSTHSTTSTTSSSSNKSVQFSKFVKVSYTFHSTEYDRLPIDVEEMTSMDYYEFYQMQYQMYQTMKAEITLRQLGMGGVTMPTFEEGAESGGGSRMVSVGVVGGNGMGMGQFGQGESNIPMSGVEVQTQVS